MQLLFEEFFSKINKFGKGSPTIIIFVKIIFFVLIIGILSLFFYAIYTGKFWIIWVIIIVYSLAELAHRFRKSREKVMVDRITRKNEDKNPHENILKPEKAKNKDLLSISKPKNENLLSKKK